MRKRIFVLFLAFGMLASLLCVNALAAGKTPPVPSETVETNFGTDCKLYVANSAWLDAVTGVTVNGVAYSKASSSFAVWNNTGYYVGDGYLLIGEEKLKGNENAVVITAKGYEDLQLNIDWIGKRCALVQPHIHAYVAKVTAPTCTEKGYTVYTCDCGDTYTGDYTEALGHVWDEGRLSESGTLRFYTCIVCKKATKTETVMPETKTPPQPASINKNFFYDYVDLGFTDTAWLGSITGVTVNGVPYTQNTPVGKAQYAVGTYSGAFGWEDCLKIGVGAMTRDVNEIVVQANGYQKLTLWITKDYQFATLKVADGVTGKVLVQLSAQEVNDLDITTLAYKLNCTSKTVDGESYLFAGWFTQPQACNDWDNGSWQTKSAKNKRLAADGSTIYAYYIRAEYLKTTIAYQSNQVRAAKVFALSTVPGDIFSVYGFVLSTAASASDSTLYAGEMLDGLKAANITKNTVYSYIAAAPFGKTTTANAFNGNLGGAQDGNDGYLAYSLITNMPLGKTVSARAYYVTLDGTIIYGATAKQLLEAGRSVTGLE